MVTITVLVHVNVKYFILTTIMRFPEQRKHFPVSDRTDGGEFDEIKIKLNKTSVIKK